MWDWDRFGRNQFLGEVRLPLSSLDLTDTADHWYSLLDKVWAILLYLCESIDSLSGASNYSIAYNAVTHFFCHLIADSLGSRSVRAIVTLFPIAGCRKSNHSTELFCHISRAALTWRWITPLCWNRETCVKARIFTCSFNHSHH